MIYAYLWSGLAVGLAASVAKFLESSLSLPNPAMVFLPAVLFSATSWGLGPSIFASLLSVLTYDFFFVPPFYTFTIAKAEDVFTLIILLIVAILTSNLAGRVRDQAEAARRREAKTAALYALSREIASAAGLEAVLKAIVDQVAQIVNAKTIVLLPNPSGQLILEASHPWGIELTEAELATATWAWQHNQPAGRGTDPLPGAEWCYLPLRTAHSTVGVLGLQFETPNVIIAPDQRRLVEALAGQAAVAIERTRLVQDMQQTRLLAETERLRTALLSSISHDLRTPLASIIGAVTSLLDTVTYGEAARRDLLLTIQEEAERLNRFVGNLLDMTRLESGALELHREWVEIGDVIGAALGRLAQALGQHRVSVDIDPDLPLLWLDFVLIEQVLVNLLDNAARYSPAGTTIHIRARRQEDSVIIEVADEGVGVPPDDLERIFDKFYRLHKGDRQSAGIGLGLSICRGIVEAHGGRIAARSAGTGRGTSLIVTFPLEKEPPTVAAEQVTYE